MRYKEKIELLKQIVSNSLPLSIDYKSHNGEYRIEMPVLQNNHAWAEELRIVTLRGILRGDKMSARAVIKDEVRWEVSDLPLVETKGDATPVYQIVRDSILFADAVVGIPDLYRILQKIEKADYPFVSSGAELLPEKESAFMRQIADRYANTLESYAGKVLHTTPKSSQFKQAVDWNEEDTQRKTSINATLRALGTCVPQKEQADSWTPDVYTYEHDMDYADQILYRQALCLNTRRSKTKEKFWWDYFKLNVLLSDPEYNQGFYLLLNQWKISEIQKWLAEYRELGYYESVAGKTGIVFIIKSTAKSSFKILNASGQLVKATLRRNKNL